MPFMKPEDLLPSQEPVTWILSVVGWHLVNTVIGTSF